MSTNDSKNTTETNTAPKVPAPDGKSDLPTTLLDFPGPSTTPPPAESVSVVPSK